METLLIIATILLSAGMIGLTATDRPWPLMFVVIGIVGFITSLVILIAGLVGGIILILVISFLWFISASESNRTGSGSTDASAKQVKADDN